MQAMEGLYQLLKQKFEAQGQDCRRRWSLKRPALRFWRTSRCSSTSFVLA
jgi:hypothetical protein